MYMLNTHNALSLYDCILFFHVTFQAGGQNTGRPAKKTSHGKGMCSLFYMPENLFVWSFIFLPIYILLRATSIIRTLWLSKRFALVHAWMHILISILHYLNSWLSEWIFRVPTSLDYLGCTTVNLEIFMSTKFQICIFCVQIFLDASLPSKNWRCPKFSIT